MADKLQRHINALTSPIQSAKHTFGGQGEAGFDNCRDNIDPHIVTQVVSSKEMTLSSAIITNALITNLNISGGDLYFTGDGSGLPYGDIYFKNNAGQTQITGANTPAAVSGAWITGVNNAVTLSSTGGQAAVQVTKAGKYMVNVSSSVQSVAGGGSTMSMDISGADIFFDNLHSHRDLSGGGGEVGAVALSGIVDLAANETLSLWIQNTTGSENYIIEDASWNVVMVGGT